MRAMWWGLLGVLVLCGMGLTPGVWAQPNATATGGGDQVDALIGHYNLHPAIEKLGRGVTNALGGWLEIPLNIHKRYAAHDSAASLVTGAVYGTIKGVVRTGVGVYEAVTFFLPYPENFAPILPTLEYFDRSPNRESLPLE